LPLKFQHFIFLNILAGFKFLSGTGTLLQACMLVQRKKKFIGTSFNIIEKYADKVTGTGLIFM
jgi:hypothetical protein